MKKHGFWFNFWRNITIWILSRFDDAIVVICGTMVCADEEKENHGHFLGHNTFVAGEPDVLREIFTSIYEENPDFLTEIIMPSLENLMNPKRRAIKVPVQEKGEKEKPEKPKRTVN